VIPGPPFADFLTAACQSGSEQLGSTMMPVSVARTLRAEIRTRSDAARSGSNGTRLTPPPPWRALGQMVSRRMIE
jgi:hypothetical protein